MKTTQELNSRWYWRLIKVAYIWIFLITIAASIGWVYYGLLDYNPSNIKLVENKIQKEAEFISDIQKYNQTIENKFWKYISINEFKSYSWFFMWTGIDTNIKNIKILLALWYNISNVNPWEVDSDLNGYNNWLENTGWYLYVKRNDIDSWESYIENSDTFIKNAISELNDVKNGGYAYFSDYPISNDYEETLGNKEYLGFMWWIKLILLSVLAIAVNILCFYLIRWIVYYIILWRFNPEK